ncbi:MAG: hypothetical protein ACHQK9_03830 [Reyranellales bacterium]
MSLLRPLWLALRAAVIATAVFWAAINIVDKIGWQAPLNLTEELVFFVVFFCGVLMVGRK